MEFHLSGNKNSSFLPCSEEMAEYDRAAISAGRPGIELMERAGAEIASAIFAVSDIRALTEIVILCGSGNNGGDGYVIARLLGEKCKNVRVIAVSSKKTTAENEAQRTAFKAGGGAVLLWDKSTAHEVIRSADIIIDALLGTGQREAPRGEIKEILDVVAKVRKARSHLIAVDVPSGIDATTGEIFSPCFRADFTFTVEFIKRGMMQYPARGACGIIKAVSIGIQGNKPSEYTLVVKENAGRLDPRDPAAHKGTFGHVLVIGGSRSYPGAPVLAAHAALRSGAGLVTMSALSSINYPSLRPEIIFRSLADRRGFYGKPHIKSIRGDLDRFSAIVLGPGLGTQKDTAEFVAEIASLISKKEIPAVIDADALNLLTTSKKLSSCVLTPHPGEMGRLLKSSTEKVQRNRYLAASTLAAKYGCAVVLKGPASITYCGGAGGVNSSGNPYMATAGSGDVLSGMIGAFMAQGKSPADSARLAVYLHGLSGDIAFERTQAPLIAGDLIDFIPNAIAKIS